MAATTFKTTSGYTVKVVFTDASTGSPRFWNTGTSAFESYNAANIANYGVAATETGTTGYYTFTYPSLPEGANYEWVAYQQAGGTFATGDLAAPLIGDRFDYSGGLLTSYGLNLRYNAEGSIQADVQLWFGASDSNVQNMPANVAALQSSGGGTTVNVASDAIYAGPVNNTTGEVDIYRADAQTLSWTFSDYTGSTQNGDTISLRFINKRDYINASASTYTSVLTKTGTASLSAGTLTLSFSLATTETDDLSAGANGDGSTVYRCQVINTTRNTTLVDVWATVRRRIG